MTSCSTDDVLDQPEDDVERPSCRLPPVENLDDVNENFTTISELMTALFKGIEEHAELTNANVTLIAAETSANLEKLAEDMKAILSSQTMMLTICVILVCTVLSVFKGLYEVVDLILS